MDSASNSKRRRVDKKEPEQDVNSTQKSGAFITKISVKLTLCIFDFLRLQDLVHCQQVNKLFRTNSLKTIQADQEKYAMYCAKQKNLDIDAFYLKGLLVSSSETDEKNQSTQNQGASENTQTQDISNLSLISSRVDKLIESGNKITNMLSNQACVEYILNELVDIVKPDKILHGLEALKQPNDGDTFLSIEFPDSVISTSRMPRTKISAAMLLDLAGLKYGDMKNYFVGFQEQKHIGIRDIEYSLGYDEKQYYELLLEREIMRIILTNDKVLKYFDLKTQNDQDLKQKNLLLLDWDETLYHENRYGTLCYYRPHLIKFLQCVTKFCVIFINTVGFDKEWYIRDLNENEGVRICGVFSRSRGKGWLNERIKRYHWCNIDEKHFNFLLIDDYRIIGPNVLMIPQFKGCLKDDVLLKLSSWLEKWYKYTTIDKQGTTNQFMKSHPILFTN